MFTHSNDLGSEVSAVLKPPSAHHQHKHWGGLVQVVFKDGLAPVLPLACSFPFSSSMWFLLKVEGRSEFGLIAATAASAHVVKDAGPSVGLERSSTSLTLNSSMLASSQ